MWRCPVHSVSGVPHICSSRAYSSAMCSARARLVHVSRTRCTAAPVACLVVSSVRVLYVKWTCVVAARGAKSTCFTVTRPRQPQRTCSRSFCFPLLCHSRRELGGFFTRISTPRPSAMRCLACPFGFDCSQTAAGGTLELKPGFWRPSVSIAQSFGVNVSADALLQSVTVCPIAASCHGGNGSGANDAAAGGD